MTTDALQSHSSGTGAKDWIDVSPGHYVTYAVKLGAGASATYDIEVEITPSKTIRPLT